MTIANIHEVNIDMATHIYLMSSFYYSLIKRWISGPRENFIVRFMGCTVGAYTYHTLGLAPIRMPREIPIG
jgi:hypothetical protein